MPSTLAITKIEVESFSYELKGLAQRLGGHRGGLYDPDSSYTREYSAVRIHADNGAIGEYAGLFVSASSVAEYAKGYIGTNALDRESHYQRGKSPGTNSQMAALDLALWDLAGKASDTPVHGLLGTYRRKIPAYASTIDGAMKGPLSTPESYGDFAIQCKEIGYKGFKIHPFPWSDTRDHIKTVLSVGKSVGGDLDMMLDSYCLYETYADALKVGRACDEAGFYWYEDPYSDGGVTNFSHKRLREQLKTMLLQGEKLGTIEQRLDMVVQGASDMTRADVGVQGLTGSIKLAHASEALGVDCEPHWVGPAQLHLLAATKNANYYEMSWVHPTLPGFSPPIRKNMEIDSLHSVDSDGMLEVSDDPGFGVEYDWDYISRHSTGKVTVS